MGKKNGQPEHVQKERTDKENVKKPDSFAAEMCERLGHNWRFSKQGVWCTRCGCER